MSVIFNPPLRKVWCYCSIMSWIKCLEAEKKLKEGRERESERALGNLPPYLPGTSASLFLSLTSLTFNRWSQFAGRETPHWQEMKPPRLLDTPPYPTAPSFSSSPSPHLFSSPFSHSTSKACKRNAETHLVALFPLHSSFCTTAFTPCAMRERGWIYVIEWHKLNY